MVDFISHSTFNSIIEIVSSFIVIFETKAHQKELQELLKRGSFVQLRSLLTISLFYESLNHKIVFTKPFPQENI